VNTNTLVSIFRTYFLGVASGDLRNVIRTINELPVDYSGHLTILLNDREPMIVLRNILLLMILGTVGDITEVAEVALHFWYSAFLQSAHQLLLCRIILQLVENLDDGLFSLELGKHSILTGAISMRTKALLLMMGQSDLQIDDVNNEIHRVKCAFSYYLSMFHLTNCHEDSSPPEWTVTTERTVAFSLHIAWRRWSFVDFA